MTTLLVFARASYFLTVAISTAFVLVIGVGFVVRLVAGFPFIGRGYSNSDLVSAIGFVAFAIPCYRAISRILRRQPFLSPPAGAEFAFYVGLVTLLGIIGHLFFGLGVWAIADWMVKHGDAPKQALFAFMITGVLYLTGLWISEFVLIGRTNSRLFKKNHQT